jgi:hypothetical protein
MFGFFGKGVVTPPPTATGTDTDPAKDAAKGPVVISPVRETPEEFLPEFAPKGKAKGQPSEVQAKLQALRAALAAKRARIHVDAEAEQQAKLAALRAMQAKQAAYGRGATSKGRRSESEIAIGVSTGYYGYDHNFGRFGDQIDRISDEVLKATDLVKTLTKEVNQGLATPDELERAIADLNEKVARAKLLAAKKGLSGLGEEKPKRSILTFVIVAAVAWFFLFRR